MSAQSAVRLQRQISRSFLNCARPPLHTAPGRPLGNPPPMNTIPRWVIAACLLTVFSGCCNRHGSCRSGKYGACVDDDDSCGYESAYAPYGKHHRHHAPHQVFSHDCGCSQALPPVLQPDCGCGGYPQTYSLPAGDCGCGSPGMVMPGAVWSPPAMEMPYSTGCAGCAGQTYLPGGPPVMWQSPTGEPNSAPASEYYIPRSTPTPAPGSSTPATPTTAPAPPAEPMSRVGQPSLLIPAGL
jgi:hypothetical protein